MHIFRLWLARRGNAFRPGRGFLGLALLHQGGSIFSGWHRAFSAIHDLFDKSFSGLPAFIDPSAFRFIEAQILILHRIHHRAYCVVSFTDLFSGFKTDNIFCPFSNRLKCFF
jgi:hypothetical protein